MLVVTDEKLNPQGRPSGYGMFISYRVKANKDFAKGLYQKAVSMRKGDRRMSVYFDKMEIRDGEQFGSNFANGLAGSTVGHFLWLICDSFVISFARVSLISYSLLLTFCSLFPSRCSCH